MKIVGGWNFRNNGKKVINMRLWEDIRHNDVIMWYIRWDVWWIDYGFNKEG